MATLFFLCKVGVQSLESDKLQIFRLHMTFGALNGLQVLSKESIQLSEGYCSEGGAKMYS